MLEWTSIGGPGIPVGGGRGGLLIPLVVTNSFDLYALYSGQWV